MARPRGPATPPRPPSPGGDEAGAVHPPLAQPLEGSQSIPPLSPPALTLQGMGPNGRPRLLPPPGRRAGRPAGGGGEACVGNARGEGAPDRERAHRIRVAPEEERRRLDRLQPGAEIGSVVDEPTRYSREGEEILGAPVDGAELCQVEAAGGSDEYEPGEAFRGIEREAGSEYPAHRLRDDVAWLLRKALEPPPVGRCQRVAGRGEWNVAEAGPAKHVRRAAIGESIAHRPPEPTAPPPPSHD